MTAQSAKTVPQGGWWRWPLLALLVVATLSGVVAYFIWFLTGDLDIIQADIGRQLAIVVDAILASNALFWMIPGLVVLRRADWHPVGWLLLACGLGYALSFDLAYPETWDVLRVPHRWAAWVADGWGNSVAFTSTVGLLSVFPDGLPRQPKLRRWALIRIGAALIGLVASGLGSTMGGHVDATFEDVEYANPTGLGFIPIQVAGWMFLFTLLSMIGAAAALWRRSRHVEAARRGQYTWVLFPFALMIGSIVVAIPLSTFAGDSVWLAVVSMYFLVPIAFSIAIVRQRLFDVDRLVSRTVTYGVVALVVAAIYVVPVLVLPDLLGLSGDVAVAGATLLAAAAFAPLRRRVQGRVERRFNRAHYDAERIVSGLSGRLQALADRGAVVDELGGAAVAALQPRSVAVWLRAPGP